MESRHVVVMKAGTHAGLGFGDIAKWKIADLRATGVTFWGYRGTLCHPTRQVQPFAAAADGEIEVAMIPTRSDPGNPALPATAWSADKTIWEPLPDGITVTGSTHALVLSALEHCEDTLDLAMYRVGIGPSAGRPAPDYLRHRIDKACLTQTTPTGPLSHSVPVVLRGRLTAPWAVFLR